MSRQIDRITQNIRELQEQLEAEISKRREQFRYRVENGRVIFEQEALRRNRALRERLMTFLKRTRPSVVLTAPVIYSLIVPFVILDICVTLYHRICFPVYGIPRVRRSDYIRLDRHHLGYLNGLQKLSCLYCGYCNGLIAYIREIAGRTEAYWCPIKHAINVSERHQYYPQFIDYGDAERFQDGLAESRDRVKRGDS